MSGKRSRQSSPGDAHAAQSTDAAMNAMGMAMANRDAILKSLAERREQVFKLLDAQREEALKPMLRAEELLRQTHKSMGISDTSGAAPVKQESTHDDELAPADPRQRLCTTLTNAFTVLLALQGAGGVAADGARKRAVSGIADALADLVEAEVDRLLHG